MNYLWFIIIKSS